MYVCMYVCIETDRYIRDTYMYIYIIRLLIHMYRDKECMCVYCMHSLIIRKFVCMDVHIGMNECMYICIVFYV